MVGLRQVYGAKAPGHKALLVLLVNWQNVCPPRLNGRTLVASLDLRFELVQENRVVRVVGQKFFRERRRPLPVGHDRDRVPRPG